MAVGAALAVHRRAAARPCGGSDAARALWRRLRGGGDGRQRLAGDHDGGGQRPARPRRARRRLQLAGLETDAGPRRHPPDEPAAREPHGDHRPRRRLGLHRRGPRVPSEVRLRHDPRDRGRQARRRVRQGGGQEGRGEVRDRGGPRGRRAVLTSASRGFLDFVYLHAPQRGRDRRSGHVKLLIVEDDAVLRDLWLDVFREAGHDAVGVASAERARERLLLDAYDGVILDLCLGEDSGLSVATLASYTNPDCRVMMITGSNLFVRGELFTMTPNIVAVLRKPISIHELVAVAEYEVRGLPAGIRRGQKYRNGDAREEVDAAALVSGRP
ncbi:response regulator [Rhodobacteraceae bacterium CCMM004]|nr:response regulator [Rhodobacteraceae bacterium CCMM004]